MPVLEFYRNCEPCSGFFSENEDPKGRHVPDQSDMEVPPTRELYFCLFSFCSSPVMRSSMLRCCDNLNSNLSPPPPPPPNEMFAIIGHIFKGQNYTLEILYKASFLFCHILHLLSKARVRKLEANPVHLTE